MRLPNIFESDAPHGTLPRTTYQYDLLARFGQTSTTPISEGTVGACYPEERLADVNIGSSPAKCRTVTRFSHWFYGGEYTLPIGGTNALLYYQGGLGGIVGYFPPRGRVPYYRLNYMPPRRPDLLEKTEYRGGMPLDIISGDEGIQTLDGYGYGILAGGPAYMGAGPFCNISFFDQNDVCNLSTLNFKHTSGVGEERHSTNQVKNKVNKSEKYYMEYKVLDTDEPPLFQHFGSIGNIWTFGIQQKYYTNISPTGSRYTKAASDILFGVGDVPKITGVVSTFDPEQLKKDDTQVDEIKEYSWVDGIGKISQEIEYLKTAHETYYQQFKLDTAATSSMLDSIFHIRQDGSIILMGKGGATIELNAEGDVVISPKRHLKIQSGGNVSILAGKELKSVSNGTSTIRSTHSGVQVLAQDTATVYSEQGKLRLHTDSTDGIQLYSMRGNSQIFTNNIYLTATNSIYSKAPRNVEEGTVKNSIYNAGLVKHRVHYHSGEYFGLKLDSAFHINSSNFLWSGTSFLFNGTASGILNARNPIQINHVHSDGRDIFRTVSCLKGCRVAYIKTPSLSVPSQRVNIMDEQELEIPEKTDLTLVDGTDTTEDYYLTPWQIVNKTGNWDLSRPIAGNQLFPSKNKLYTVSSGQVSQTSWTQYSI